MIECLLIAAVCTVMVRLAEMQQANGYFWGCVTLLCCVASWFVLPGLPLIRIAIAGVVSFGCMFVGNLRQKQK